VSETASDTAGAGSTPPVTEEQVRELLARLRQAPVEQVVAELLSSLLNAAQAKLGRRDARLLIDLSGLVMDHVRRYVSTSLADQVDQALTQLRLRLGQVRAEGAASSGERRDEPNDLAETPTPPAGAAAPAAEQPRPSPPSSAASRLWVPGRDL